VVSRSGKKFSIEEAYVMPYETVIYHYYDPVTSKLERAHSKIYGSIQSIKIGEHLGTTKVNPETGEYFPASFIFDPYTGQKLKWANRK
jgi:hypothetical protein